MGQTDGQKHGRTDEHQTDALRSLLDAANVTRW